MRTPSSPRATAAEVKETPRRSIARVPRSTWAYLALLVLLALLLYWCATAIVRGFHWAESRVDRTSWRHMAYFFLMTLPFNTGLPIPIVHQVWAVAIGCFFGWRAYPILFASLCIGVPLPFAIGRWLAARRGVDHEGGGAVATRLRQLVPRAFSYLTPMRRAIASRPVRSSFLLMWAPLPTSFLPLLVGFLVPRDELRFGAFVAGALPSKLLHFACDVLVGIEAGSLATALDAHDDLPGVNDLPSRHRHARAIAVGAMVLTVAFVTMMVYTMHQALNEMKAKQIARDESHAHLLSSAV